MITRGIGIGGLLLFTGLRLAIAAPPAEPGLPPAEPGLQVEHYGLQVSFDAVAQTISGVSVLTLSWERSPQGRLTVDMADSLSARAVRLDGKPVGYEHQGSKLLVTLPPALSTGREHVLEVSYGGKPNPRYLHFHTVAGEPAIASYGLPFSAMGWWPTLDEPLFKAAGADVILTAPQGTMAISNGTLIGTEYLPDGRRRFHWRERSPIYPDVISATIGPYDIIDARYRSESGRTIALHYYVYPADKARAEPEFAAVPDILRVYESLFGPYPFAREKYGIAEVPFPSFREHQTVPSLGRDLILGTAEAWDLHSVGNVIAHDMAHQWFGDSLTPRRWSDVWLNEAFANYAVALWHERRGGEAAYRRFMRSLDAGSFSGSVYIAPDRPAEELLTYVTFNKGAWVLHMLRHIMGDERFFAALHGYVQANSGGLVDTGTWRAACEHAYGQSLGWFFAEWVYGQGRPALRMSWNAIPQTGGFQSHVTIEQTQAGQVFTMPVDVEWTGAGRSGRQTVWLRQRRQDFTLSTPAAPSRVILDPDHWLLRN
ncbi:MAG TPA: M1 family metallopeptidase [Steroidobacteraceae bacterium]|nr:M1 family metallopeptidase [Steroidobacteraceae bacterium]